ncbi:MAG: ATP-binding protein [Deltaproteobacteria bacterium]|nr:MAG: ATP-binding protein [Deltaproteobacteria bacterium]
MQPNPVARGQQGQAPLSPEEIPEVFNPAAPTTRRDSFAGRTEQLAQIVDVVAQRGQHAVVYGERGVGKTSLAVVATGALVERRILALRVNCDGSDDFVSIWRKVVREAQMGRPLPPVVGIRELLTEATASAGSLLAATHVTVDVVRQALQILSHPAPIVVVLDEFDRLEHVRTKRLFADTIKALSDHIVLATVIFVGVAETPEMLLGEHRSIERGLRAIHVPRMSAAELAVIVRLGFGKLQMSIADDAVARIGELSDGFPYHAHSLGLLASREAIRSGQGAVQVVHVDRVAPQVIH